MTLEELKKFLGEGGVLLADGQPVKGEDGNPIRLPAEVVTLLKSKSREDHEWTSLREKVNALETENVTLKADGNRPAGDSEVVRQKLSDNATKIATLESENRRLETELETANMELAGVKSERDTLKSAAEADEIERRDNRVDQVIAKVGKELGFEDPDDLATFARQRGEVKTEADGKVMVKTVVEGESGEQEEKWLPIHDYGKTLLEEKPGLASGNAEGSPDIEGDRKPGSGAGGKMDAAQLKAKGWGALTEEEKTFLSNELPQEEIQSLIFQATQNTPPNQEQAVEKPQPTLG